MVTDSFKDKISECRHCEVAELDQEGNSGDNLQEGDVVQVSNHMRRYGWNWGTDSNGTPMAGQIGCVRELGGDSVLVEFGVGRWTFYYWGSNRPPVTLLTKIGHIGATLSKADAATPTLKFGDDMPDPPKRRFSDGDTAIWTDPVTGEPMTVGSPTWIPAEWEKKWERTDREGVYRCREYPELVTARCCAEHGPYMSLLCPVCSDGFELRAGGIDEFVVTSSPADELVFIASGRERASFPDGVWMLPRGKRWVVLKVLARLLGAKNVPAAQKMNILIDSLEVAGENFRLETFSIVQFNHEGTVILDFRTLPECSVFIREGTQIVYKGEVVFEATEDVHLKEGGCLLGSSGV